MASSSVYTDECTVIIDLFKIIIRAKIYLEIIHLEKPKRTLVWLFSWSHTDGSPPDLKRLSEL